MVPPVRRWHGHGTMATDPPADPRGATRWSYRTLGSTGIQVSVHCLGAMMFGAMGNPDHDDCVRMIHRGARRRHQLHRHRRRVLAGRVGGDRRQGAEGPARRRRARHQVPGPMGDGRPNRQGGSRRWIMHEPSRRACAGSAPTTSTSTRATGPTRAPTSRRRSAALTDLVRQGKVRAIGTSTFPAERIVEAQWVVGAPRPRAVPLRAAAVLDLRARHRAGGAADVPALRHGRDRVEPAQRRLAHRQVPPRPAAPEPGTRAARRFVAGRRWSSDNARRPAQVRPASTSCARGRRRRDVAHPPGPRVGARAPGGDVGDHRAPPPEQLEDALAGADVRLDARRPRPHRRAGARPAPTSTPTTSSPRTRRSNRPPAAAPPSGSRGALRRRIPRRSRRAGRWNMTVT